MTLTSGPVSAGLCTTCSMHGSIRPSGKQAAATCGGRTPDAWSKLKKKDWPQTCEPGTHFSPLFSPSLNRSNVSLMNVVESSSYDTVARHCVAAYLNASASPPLTPPTILSAGMTKTIWSSYATKGYFEPTAGVRWTSAQIVDWIKTTFS